MSKIRIDEMYEEWADIEKDKDEVQDYLSGVHYDKILAWLEENEIENKVAMEFSGSLPSFLAEYSYYASEIETFYLTVGKDGQQLYNPIEAREYADKFLFDLIKGVVDTYSKIIL